MGLPSGTARIRGLALVPVSCSTQAVSGHPGGSGTVFCAGLVADPQQAL